jgi:hypothetical protein
MKLRLCHLIRTYGLKKINNKFQLLFHLFIYYFIYKTIINEILKFKVINLYQKYILEYINLIDILKLFLNYLPK